MKTEILPGKNMTEGMHKKQKPKPAKALIQLLLLLAPEIRVLLKQQNK